MCGADARGLHFHSYRLRCARPDRSSAVKRKISRFLLYGLFLSRFITSTVPAQIALGLLAVGTKRVPERLLGYLIVCAGYVGIVVVINPAYAPVSNFLFYFSFVPAFLVMLATRAAESEEFLTARAMKLISLLTFLDAVAMNSFLRPYMWFYPEGHVHGQSMIFGFYNRPAGIAAVTSSSGALAVFMLVLSDWWHPREALTNRRTLWTLATLVLLQSGTGFAMFSAYVLLRVYSQYRSSIQKRGASLVVLAGVVAAIYLTLGISDETAAQWRFSFAYARLVYDIKVEEVIRSTFGNFDTLMLGAQIDATLVGNITTSDFGVLGMLMGIGIVGTVLVLLPPLLFWTRRRSMALPTAFFYACFLHYPALSSPPGAVMYAVFLFMLRSASVKGRG